MHRKLLFCFLCIMPVFFNAAKGQTIRERMTVIHPTCNDVYLNALQVLPKLYRQNAIDSMYLAVDIWKTSCGNIPEIKYTTLLMAIDQASFKVDSLDSNTVDLLAAYAGTFYFSQQNTAAYFEKEKSFYTFSSTWAKLILKEKKPGETEQFICKVFAGEITDPISEIKKHRETYPQLAALLRQKEVAGRKAFRSNFGFLVGTWLPAGDLKILGSHPSIGIQFGGRNAHNQFDFTMQFRFLKSANTYLVKRNNALYESDHYFGGYIGIDYTRYLLNTQTTDIGILAGMGYDGFDVFKSSNNNSNNALRPLSINSFNANGGLKFNFYVTSSFYLGLQGRYNWVSYKNTGGTSFNGNAFSIDLIIGSNTMRNR